MWRGPNDLSPKRSLWSEPLIEEELSGNSSDMLKSSTLYYCFIFVLVIVSLTVYIISYDYFLLFKSRNI